MTPCASGFDKAEEDYNAALALKRLRRHPTHNAVCFHAHQCIEKYLKALLETRGEPIPKTHSLPTLLDQCISSHPLLSGLRTDLISLTVYAVEFHYPGESANEVDAQSAVMIMRQARTDLRAALGLC